MNGFEYLVSLGARMDVLLIIAGLSALTLVIAVTEGLKAARAAREVKREPDNTTAWCTSDDYPVPDSLKDSRDKEGAE